LDAAEFDKFADEYLAVHARNIRVSGEAPEYFARYKIEAIARRWTAWGKAPPRAVLDFGSGIGASLPHLARTFPDAALTALDVSARSLAVAAARFPGLARQVLHDGAAALPLPDEGFDLAFASCVFHHIDPSAHEGLFAELRRVLRPGGVLAVFEHNPVNPVTRYIVASCPFDENAVLIPPWRMRRGLTQAGFRGVEVRFTGFFPSALAALRPFEGLLGWVPVGAQYYGAGHV